MLASDFTHCALSTDVTELLKHKTYDRESG
ncbi:hypothetical protein BsWGS_07213 [Bradybaena similaris]